MKPKRLPRLWCALMGVLPLGAETPARPQRGVRCVEAKVLAAKRKMTLPRGRGPGTVGHGSV